MQNSSQNFIGIFSFKKPKIAVRTCKTILSIRHFFIQGIHALSKSGKGSHIDPTGCRRGHRNVLNDKSNHYTSKKIPYQQIWGNINSEILEETLNIEIFDLLRMSMNKLLARQHFGSHERITHMIGAF